MFDRIHYAVVMVSDMDRSVAFYRDVLGFKLRFHSQQWSEFDTGGTTLALYLGGRKNSSDPSEQAKWNAGTVSLGFSVGNLDEATAELQQRGIRFLVEPTDGRLEGIRLAVFTDPDGLPISVAEPENRG